MDNFSFAQAAYPSPVVTPTTPRVLPIDQFANPSEVRHLVAHLKGHGRKRWRKINANNLASAMNKSTIRRLARRGGVKRIKVEIYKTVQDIIEYRIAEILRPAIALVEHKKQKTLTALDVVYALRVIGNPIYGCGTIYHGDNVSSNAEYMRKRRVGHAQNVRDVQRRLEREAHERRIDEQVRRMGGSVNLRRR